jgi:vacuolar-type H+-ATPase subunit H
VNTLGGEIGVTGFYETTQPAKPTFDVGLKMTKVDIPAAFRAFTTVQMLAPVAKYAVGSMSTDLRVNGALGKNMMPLFPALSGGGSVQTSNLDLKDFPPLEKIVDVTKLQFLDNPGLNALRAAFQIREGRLFVKPFDVKLGGTTMTVSGSNGFDQSLQYALGLRVPRSLMGGGANSAISGLLSKAGGAGIDLNAAPEIPLGIQLAGTVTNPSIKVDVSSVASSVKEGVQQAVQQAATQKLSAEATKLVQEAEQKAASIRQEAQTLAGKVKLEGYQQADSLTAKATSPILKLAAKPAADELRKQADSKAAGIVREANQRADSLVAQARRQADKTADGK